MHCLEMAKTAWNSVVADQVVAGTARERQLFRDAKTHLAMAKEVLLIFGPEGDEGGPLEEIETLEQVLEQG